MWPLRTFCCIGKVSRTFLGRNAKIALAQKGRGPKIMVRMLEIRERKFWCLLESILTTSNKNWFVSIDFPLQAYFGTK